MKVAILNDQNMESWLGGAALVNERIKKALEDRGDDVTIILENSKVHEWKKEMIYDYDYFILANFAYFPEKDMLELAELKPFSTFRHDIPHILYTQPPSIMYTSFYKYWGKMFEKADNIFFISPMQAKVFTDFFAIPEDSVSIIPPPLSIEGFSNKHKVREGNLYLGDISEARGIRDTLQIMKQVNPDGPHTFAGKMLDESLRDYLKENGALYIGEIHHDMVPEVMNKNLNFFYYPKIYDSFCLKIVEAELCGMKIYADSLRIGRFSYKQTVLELKEFIETTSLKVMMDNIKQTDILMAL